MTEKSILITGCSSGIGEAAALTMKERGWRVFATARKEEDLARLTDQGVDAIYLDYTEQDSITACAQKVLADTNNTLFALFNNGTYGQGGAVEDVPTDVLRAQFEAGFFGWHELTRQLIPAMRKQKAGRIVNCSSVLGLAPFAYRGPYTSMKFALEGLTMTLRLELDDSGIAVSLIEPGPIRTRFVEHYIQKFKETITVEGSPHEDVYHRRMNFLNQGGDSRWKLEPSAVVDKLIHAVESSYPKPHYYVTTPTYIIDIARRTMPNALYYRFLKAAGSNS